MSNQWEPEPLVMPFEDGREIPIPEWVNVQVGDTIKVELHGAEARWFLNGIEVLPPESGTEHGNL